METTTTCVFIVCCVVFGFASFCCPESFSSLPNDDDMLEMNITTEDNVLATNRKALTTRNSLLSTEKHASLKSKMSLKINDSSISTENETLKSSRSRVTSPFLYSTWNIVPIIGYFQHLDLSNDVTKLYGRVSKSNRQAGAYLGNVSIQISDSIPTVTPIEDDVRNKDNLLICPSYLDLESFNTGDLDFTEFHQVRYEHKIRIQNTYECLQQSLLLINSSTLLDIKVDGSVSNCSHEIIIVSTHTTSNIIFGFAGHPQLKGASIRKTECTDVLDIIEVNELRQNKSIISRHKRFGTYCTSHTSRIYRHIQQEKAKFVLRLSSKTQCCDKMNFKVIVLPCRRFLNEAHDCNQNITGTYGHVTSPGFLFNIRYPNNIACKWTISAPQGTLLRLTPQIFRITDGDVVSITATNRYPSLQFPKHLIFSNKHPWILPYVVPSNECILEFSSDAFVTSLGFNISFQTVAESRFLPLMDNNRFNCSGITNLPPSILCNFVADCVDGEDEAACDYKNKNCPGGYFFDDTCIWVIPNVGVRLSWFDAAGYCWKHKTSRLITFQTVRKRQFYDRLHKALQIDRIFLGLTRSPRYIQMYSRLWIWSHGSTAFYLPHEFRSESDGTCSLFYEDHFHAIDCNDIFEDVTIVCERTLRTKRNMVFPKLLQPKYHPPWSIKLEVFACDSGEVISVDQKCDRKRDCFDNSDEEGCGDYSTLIHKRFECNSWHLLAYTFVCDGFSDCQDVSDELFCLNRSSPDRYSTRYYSKYDYNSRGSVLACPENTTSCPGFYCMPNSWITDGEIDCPVRDWQGKRVVKETFQKNEVLGFSPPGVVIPDGYGKIVIKPLNTSEQCPPTHLQCLDGFCIPLAMVDNNHIDCPYEDDEITEILTEYCNNAYKCRKSRKCIRYDDMCDGKFDCPRHDDERLCLHENRTCPFGCKCFQKEFACTWNFSFDGQPLIKAHSFSISWTDISSLENLNLDSQRLIFLDASRNKINTIEEDFIYPNLKVLNLSYNAISYLPPSAFTNCRNLETLSLASNLLQNSQFSFLNSTPFLKFLDISGNRMPTVKDGTFISVPNLRILILRNMGIKEIKAKAFWGLNRLKILDIKGNKIVKFSPLLFKKQKTISKLLTDNFRLCCDQIAPRNVLEKGECITSYDDISSCDDMLRTNALRISLWIMALLTILGNVGVICHRIFWDNSNRLTYRVLITCLSFSDLMMGVYLVIIGTADVMYRDRFLSVEEVWKDSIKCRVAGHLCVLSSEVSAMLILVVTVDRAIAIALPLRRGLPLSNRSVGAVCVVVWLVGMTIASIPIVPPFNSWELYSQLAVGVPLPLTRNRFPGYEFAFAIFIVLNVTTFILVVLGQLVIWLGVKKRSKVLMTHARMKQDLAIAQKLFLVVLTDCVCWFPISVMGLLAFRGIAVPGTMHIIATVFLLPANSALNPFLYTLNALLLKRTRDRSRSM